MRLYLCVFQRKGRELVAEILRQTGRDHPGVTMAGVEPSGSPSPYVVHTQVIADTLTHIEMNGGASVHMLQMNVMSGLSPLDS